MLSYIEQSQMEAESFQPEHNLHFSGKEPYNYIKDGECLILSI
jgi:hypothetical protein